MTIKDESIRAVFQIKDNVDRDGYLDSTSANILLSMIFRDMKVVEDLNIQLKYVMDNNGEYLEIKEILN